MALAWGVACGSSPSDSAIAGHPSAGQDAAASDASGAAQKDAGGGDTPITGSDGAGGDDGALHVPEPGCAAATTGDRYEFLDDVCQRKAWPSDANRAWQCPNRASRIPDGYSVASDLDAVTVDTHALTDVTNDLDLTVIVVKRDASGTPHYRYYSNGRHLNPVEPTSSTKFMAIASAGAALRAASKGKVGLPATNGGVPLGDLITVIHNYNADHFQSNVLAGFFLEIGGHDRLNDLIHAGWLHRPSFETLGGDYGASGPELPFTFSMPSGDSITVQPDRGIGPNNRLSTLTMSEALRRLVMHREDAATRMPDLAWEDVQVLFYGAEEEKWFPLPSESGVAHPHGWGGMTGDAAIYMQSAVDIRAIEQRSRGQWRIFSKLGYGQSGFAENAYACFPELDSSGHAIVDRGVELIVSTHFAQPKDDPPASRQRDALIAGYYKLLVARARSGKL